MKKWKSEKSEKVKKVKKWLLLVACCLLLVACCLLLVACCLLLVACCLLLVACCLVGWLVGWGEGEKVESDFVEKWFCCCCTGGRGHGQLPAGWRRAQQWCSRWKCLRPESAPWLVRRRHHLVVAVGSRSLRRSGVYPCPLTSPHSNPMKYFVKSTMQQIQAEESSSKGPGAVLSAGGGFIQQMVREALFHSIDR